MVGFVTYGAVIAALTFAKMATDPDPAKVDAIFKAYDRPDSPGCALAVERDGKLLYEKGYGMASLEYSVPIRPTTIFHVASVSKQVTAYAIQLLVDDGKLKLDDDIRKYVPELHDFGHLISISNLLHHTSGLRDQWDLVMLGGWRMEDVITEADLLGLLTKQTKLSFLPGTRYDYCNSGYMLLGVIVERVSGQSLAAFCQERLFKPLGMTRTHFHDDYQLVVADRAQSYNAKEGGGFQLSLLSYSNVGATSLFTTVEDFAKWNHNLVHPTVGSPALLTRMMATQPLSDGRKSTYASGLIHGTFRGLNVLEHSGSDAAFRSDSLLFPDQKLSILVFSNFGEVAPTVLARSVAGLYLGDVMHPARRTPKSVPVELGLLAAYAGTFEFDPGRVATLDVQDGKLRGSFTGGDPVALVAINDHEFDWKDVGRLQFEALKDGSYGCRLVAGDGDYRGVRQVLSPISASDYVGDYYSPELEQVFHVKQAGDTLQLSFLKNADDLVPMGTDLFGADWRVVRFVRHGGKVVTMTVSTGRSFNIEFKRVSL